jgi:hypothetical protein
MREQLQQQADDYHAAQFVPADMPRDADGNIAYESGNFFQSARNIATAYRNRVTHMSQHPGEPDRRPERVVYTSTNLATQSYTFRIVEPCNSRTVLQARLPGPLLRL